MVNKWFISFTARWFCCLFLVLLGFFGFGVCNAYSEKIRFLDEFKNGLNCKQNDKRFNTNLKELDKKNFEIEFGKGKVSRFVENLKKKGNYADFIHYIDRIEELKLFFERFCKKCSSDIAILKYNSLNNLLTENRDGWHAYFVFSPTFILKMLNLSVDRSFFDHVCLELSDSFGNVYRQNSSFSNVMDNDSCQSRPCFSNSGVCIDGLSAHGDHVVFDILIKNKADFKFMEGSLCVVRLFFGDFDKRNMLIEFKVVAHKATYNLFSRLGEIPDFYSEFSHPANLDLDFYMGC